MSASSSGGPLAALSDDLAAAVDTVGRSVVAIHARRRIPASGVVWQPGVIVAAHHTIQRDDEITVTLHDGTTAAATLAGTRSVDRSRRPPPRGRRRCARRRRGRRRAASRPAGARARPAGHDRHRQPRHRERGRRRVAHLARRGDRPLHPARPQRLRRLLGRPAGRRRRPCRRHQHLGARASHGPHRAREHRGARRGPAAWRAATWRAGGSASRPSRSDCRRRCSGASAPRPTAGLVVVNVEPDSPADRGGLLIGDILLALDDRRRARPGRRARRARRRPHRAGRDPARRARRPGRAG